MENTQMQGHQTTQSGKELCQDWNFQVNLPTDPIKRRAKVALGQALSVLFPNRQDQIQRAERPLPYALLDRLIATALMDRLIRQGRTDIIAEIHKHIWRRPDVLAWYATTEDWFTNRFLTEQVDFVDELQKVVSESKYHSLCEFGCGRGLLINYLASRLGGVQRFIGLDLNEHQIELNRARFSNPKLSFVATDALAWLNQQPQPGWIFFSYDALPYVPEVELEALLNNFRAKLAPTLFAIMEVIDVKHDLERELTSRPFDGVLHLSHNYPELFRRTGYTVRYRDERRTGGGRWILMLATVG
jgi:Methyltransferase domain